MSDTAKRDAVLEEFAHDAGVHRVWGVAGMADEIVCLRSANKDLIDHYEDARAEIDRLRARCRQIDDEAYDYAEQIEQLKAAAKDSADHYADARAEIDRLREERDDALIDRRFSDEQRAKWMAENVALLQRAARAERILAALREPSAFVNNAGHHTYVLKLGDIYANEGRLDRSHQPLAINAAIIAAVAAAEQEVGRE